MGHATEERRHGLRLRRGRRLWNLAARTHYGTLDERIGARLYELAVERLDLTPGQCVLDVGCGTGGAVVRLREAVGPDGRVVGVDNSPAMLARTERRVASRGWTNVDLRLADATRTSLGESEFDAAVALFSLSAMPDVPAAIRRVHDALRPGGRLLVFDVRLRPAGGPLARTGTRLLRLVYRAAAGFTGADVVEELARVFGEVRPALHPTELGDTLTVVHVTKPASGTIEHAAEPVRSTGGDR